MGASILGNRAVVHIKGSEKAVSLCNLQESCLLPLWLIIYLDQMVI